MQISFRKQFYLYLFGIFTILTSCKDSPLILFSVEEDIMLGEKVAREIESDTNSYPILSETDYPDIYNYLNNLVGKILATSKIKYRDRFAWEVKIIKDTILNAFAAPGGYIYVYAGLINFLDKEDDLMGVMGHEIAHADRRHTIRQLQSLYGVDLLLNIILGNSNSELATIAKQLAGGLSGLKFSRDHESEADEYSVIYLSETDYSCSSASSFFEKLIANDQTSGAPEFLSTHPNPSNRVEDIKSKAEDINCNTDFLNPMSYSEFRQQILGAIN